MLLLVAALVLSIRFAAAQETMPGDRVYDVHTQAQGDCPSMNWHIVASPDGVLSGTVAWEDRRVVAGLSGVIDPIAKGVERFGKTLGGNPQSRTFTGIATDTADHQHRIGNIKGTIDADGSLIANMEGAGVICHSVKVPLVPAPPG